MTSAQIEIQIIACLVAMACAIPGVFLVLRKMSLITDAISHSILPGIVVGFLITQDLNSPLLILLASVTGVVTVFLVEQIQLSGLVKKDTAIGLVFPALFSIGVLLIAKNANDIHLDIDAVLLGEIAFAPFDRLQFSGIDIGPKSLWLMLSILSINLLLLVLFFKELKISTFDKGLTKALGFSPVVIHYGLMSMASVTTVGAFDAVGAILVVALMIAPAAASYMLTNNLKIMLALSIFLGAISAILGYWLAYFLDASIAGSISCVLGIQFLIVYLFAPKKGLLSILYKNKQQQTEVSLITFLLHLNNHTEKSERSIKHLNEHINWQKVKSKRVLDLAIKNNMILIENDFISLTKKGQSFTEKAIHYIISNDDSAIESIKDDFFLFRA